MELNLVNEQGQETAKVPASDAVFARQYNEALVHQLVVAYMANARQGTRAQLNREFVHHTTKKPFRQKGTGRAETPKTKAFAAKLKAMGLTSAMLIAETVDDNLFLASRNIKNVTVVEPRYIDPLSLIHYEKIVVAKGALSKIEEMLG